MASTILQAAAAAAARACLALGLATVAGPVRADDIDAGKLKARACAVCHGVAGIAVHPEAPNLAGQPADYLSLQLHAYRSGKRQHAVMSVMAKPLSDEDISQLAAWFAAIRVEATPPR